MTTDPHDNVRRFPSVAERMLRRAQRVRLETPPADDDDVVARAEYERVLNAEAEVITRAMAFLAWAEDGPHDPTALPLAARELLDEARALRALYDAPGGR